MSTSSQAGIVQSTEKDVLSPFAEWIRLSDWRPRV